jgi:hypothetical protein
MGPALAKQCRRAHDEQKSRFAALQGAWLAMREKRPARLIFGEQLGRRGAVTVDTRRRRCGNTIRIDKVDGGVREDFAGCGIRTFF